MNNNKGLMGLINKYPIVFLAVVLLIAFGSLAIWEGGDSEETDKVVSVVATPTPRPTVVSNARSYLPSSMCAQGYNLKTVRITQAADRASPQEILIVETKEVRKEIIESIYIAPPDDLIPPGREFTTFDFRPVTGMEGRIYGITCKTSESMRDLLTIKYPFEEFCKDESKFVAYDGRRVTDVFRETYGLLPCFAGLPANQGR